MSRWRRRKMATSCWRSCCPIRPISHSAARTWRSTFTTDSPVKFPIFCGLISTDGWMLMGREKVDKFDWSAPVNNIGMPARVGAWLAGQGQYAIFLEPEPSQLELDDKAHFMASVGETVGFADYATLHSN